MAADIRSYKDLDVWKVSMELAVLAYAVVIRLPASERFELSAQIRRAAISIPSNVAEGQASGRPGRFLFHLRIAVGSLAELETDLELARRLGMLSIADLADVTELMARTGQLLHGLVRSLRRNLAAGVLRCLAFALPLVTSVSLTS
jgi:four helix bundle protein